MINIMIDIIGGEESYINIYNLSIKYKQLIMDCGQAIIINKQRRDNLRKETLANNIENILEPSKIHQSLSHLCW